MDFFHFVYHFFLTFFLNTQDVTELRAKHLPTDFWSRDGVVCICHLKCHFPLLTANILQLINVRKSILIDLNLVLCEIYIDYRCIVLHKIHDSRSIIYFLCSYSSIENLAYVPTSCHIIFFPLRFIWAKFSNRKQGKKTFEKWNKKK